MKKERLSFGLKIKACAFRNLLERPWQAVMQLSLFTLALFALGTLPWVDNWAHLFGFIFGILISLGE